MKIRNGFVSNSSSSSFIITSKKEKQVAEQHNLELYKVSDILKKLKPLHDATSCSDDMEIPWFMRDRLHYEVIIPYYDDLVELEKKNPGCYISDAFDRDIAYQLNFDFELFEGDL